MEVVVRGEHMGARESGVQEGSGHGLDFGVRLSKVSPTRSESFSVVGCRMEVLWWGTLSPHCSSLTRGGRGAIAFKSQQCAAGGLQACK
jgi:hypothetical protein